MAISPTNKVLQHLRSAVLHDGAGLTDGQLLECYVCRRDEAAFVALVRRLGPMVWGVCRRGLANHQDAEDAFQATFLVLVRKAAAVVPRERVAGWLYGVARQTTLKARALAARRRGRERQVPQMPEPAPAEPDLWHDLRPVLDQELSRLPDRYRLPIVLCDLGGKSYQEAARQLGCPTGTLSARLARARTLLARRLARHGLAVSGGALAAALAPGAASAAVPATVVSSTTQAATAGAIAPRVAALAEGVLKVMLLSRLKTLLAGLLALVILGGGFMLVRSASDAGEPAGPPARAPNVVPLPVDPGPKLNEDLRKLQGVWVAQVQYMRQTVWVTEVNLKLKGRWVHETWPNSLPRDRQWIIKGTQVTLVPAFERSGTKGTLRIDPTKQPKTFDITPVVDEKSKSAGKPSPIHGIYWLEGDTLTVAFTTGTAPRPRLGSVGGPPVQMMEFKREKAKAAGEGRTTRERLEKKAADLEQQLAAVRKELEDLRARARPAERVSVHRLKYQEADPMAKLLKKVFERDGVVIEGVNATNALVIRATREQTMEIEKLLIELDVPAKEKAKPAPRD